jgi:hypothetical protein
MGRYHTVAATPPQVRIVRDGALYIEGELAEAAKSAERSDADERAFDIRVIRPRVIGFCTATGPSGRV